MAKPKCLDCNKEINYSSKRCKKCSGIRVGKILKDRKFYDKTNNPNYKSGKFCTDSFCIDCNKKLGKLALYNDTKRCHSCSAKIIIREKKFYRFGDNPNFKHGKTLISKYCIDCGIKLGKLAFYKNALRCRKCSAKHRDVSFSNNPNWKNGISNLRRFIMRLPEYIRWRTQIFERDDYTCQECYKRGYKLNAHHIKPFRNIYIEFLQLYSQFSPIEDKETLVRLAITYQPFWNINNGKTLCEECHKKTINFLTKKYY